VRSISLQLGNILLNEGFTVIYTHEGETGLSLEDRARVASISGAELLISIHANASTNRSLAGTMTFYHAPWGADLQYQISNRKLLASCIQTELLNRLKRENKGISEANYAVLRNCPIPAALVEVAFISNYEEERLLANADFRRRAAEAIALGIKRYLAAR
jgi:N-acetylmuramoyl-L-alanine amidase